MSSLSVAKPKRQAARSLLEGGILLVALLCTVVLSAGLSVGNPIFLAIGTVPIFAALLLFTLRSPNLIFWVLVCSAPLNDHLGVPLGNLVVRPFSLFTPIAVLYLLITILRNESPKKLEYFNSVIAPFVILVGFILSKVLTSILLDEFAPMMGRVFCIKMVIFAGLLASMTVAVCWLALESFNAVLFLRFWIALTHISIVIAVIQVLISNVTHWEIVHHRDVVSFGRPFSFFREPDVYASFLGASFLITFCLKVDGACGVASERELNWTLTSTGLGLIVLFVRAAWLGTIGGFMFYGMYLIKKGRGALIGQACVKMTLAGLVALTSLAILAPSATQKLFSRFASVASPQEESASKYRIQELDAMIEHILPTEMTTEHLPRLLLGYGDFSWSFWAPVLLANNYDQDADKNRGRSQVLIHPGFNMPLAILHDNGLIGFSLLASFMASLYFLYFRALSKGVGIENEPAITGILMAITCILICFNFSYDPITPFFWVLMGVYLSLISKVLIEKESSS